MSSSALGPKTCSIGVGVYQGDREPFPQGTHVLYSLYDGNHKELVRAFHGPDVRFGSLPFQDSPADNLTVLVSVAGHGDGGFMPVRISPSAIPVVRLMLLPANPTFDFAPAAWAALQQAKPRTWNVISGTAGTAGGNPVAKGKYEGLIGASPKSIACLLNILTGMDQIQLGANKTPLDFLKDIRWDSPVKPDRFYCWADVKLIEAILEAGKLFAQEPNPSMFHGGTASRSWKEVQYSEANVQFTFHESVVNSSHPDWVQLEADIDYFKDLAAHFFGEVLVNAFGSLTEPAQAYRLRFNAGNLPGKVPFEPPYFIR